MKSAKVVVGIIAVIVVVLLIFIGFRELSEFLIELAMSANEFIQIPAP